MTKHNLIIILLFFLANHLYAQKEFEIYKKIYKTADSLKAIGKENYVESDSLFIKVKELEKKHPYSFLEAVDEYMLKSKFNEASFIYFVGLMRFKYYNSVNPDYNDNKLLNKYEDTYGGYIGHYLRTNADNFIKILQISIDYYINNDFTFFSKNNNIEKFNMQINPFNEYLKDLETNKKKYVVHWKAERIKIEEELKKPKTGDSNSGKSN